MVPLAEPGAVDLSGMDISAGYASENASKLVMNVSVFLSRPPHHTYRSASECPTIALIDIMCVDLCVLCSMPAYISVFSSYALWLTISCCSCGLYNRFTGTTDCTIHVITAHLSRRGEQGAFFFSGRRLLFFPSWFWFWLRSHYQRYCYHCRRLHRS
eukprot:COSAG05_NODE_1_length_66591_cov_307.301581_22_plen_157_part_00